MTRSDMSELRAAAERALEALEEVAEHGVHYVQKIVDLRAALAAEQPRPVAWSVAFKGRADTDYTYRSRDAAEGAADYLRAHKAELGPFAVVPLYAAPPPPATPCPHIRSNGMTHWCALAAQPAAAPTDALALLRECRKFIDTTRDPAYPAGADLADRIDAALAAREGR